MFDVITVTIFSFNTFRLCTLINYYIIFLIVIYKQITIFIYNMTCPEFKKFKANYYYELSKTIVFWTDIFLILCAVISGNYHVTINYIFD